MEYSYKPLMNFMYDNGIKKKDLREDLKISSTVVAKFEKGERVSLEIIARICRHYGIPIEQVVEIPLNNEPESYERS